MSRNSPVLRLLQRLIFKTIILRWADSSGYHLSDFKWNGSSVELKPFLSLCPSLSGKTDRLIDARFLLNTFYGPENGNIGIQTQGTPA